MPDNRSARSNKKPEGRLDRKQSGGSCLQQLGRIVFAAPTGTGKNRIAIGEVAAMTFENNRRGA